MHIDAYPIMAAHLAFHKARYHNYDYKTYEISQPTMPLSQHNQPSIQHYLVYFLVYQKINTPNDQFFSLFSTFYFYSVSKVICGINTNFPLYKLMIIPHISSKHYRQISLNHTLTHRVTYLLHLSKNLLILKSHQ